MAATMAPASMNSSLVAAPGLRAGTFAAARPAATATLPPLRRSALVVRAAQKDNKPDNVIDPAKEEPIITTKPIKRGLFDVMKFNGPAPERINGRLAMVGFVAALAVEASRGMGLLSQVGNGASLTWFAYSAVVLSAASLAPLLQGEKPEDRSGGIWTADAEIWNGRAAMLGLVALAATEYLTGSPLINA